MLSAVPRWCGIGCAKMRGIAAMAITCGGMHGAAYVVHPLLCVGAAAPAASAALALHRNVLPWLLAQAFLGRTRTRH